MNMKGLFLIALLLIISCGLVLANHTVEVKEGEWDEDTYGPKELIVWKTPVKGAVFEHKVHTMDVGLDCESCHDDSFEMLAGMAEDEDNFTMKAMEEGKYCGNCHYEGGFAFSTTTRCTSCHIGVRGVNRISEGEEPKSASTH